MKGNVLSQAESIGNSVFNDVESIGNSVFNDVTHFFGNIWHHKSTATATSIPTSVSSRLVPSTTTSSILRSSITNTISSISESTTVTSSPLTTSSPLPISTTVSNTASLASDTSQISTTASAMATSESAEIAYRHPTGMKLLLMVFLLGAFTMLTLVLLAPVVVRAFKFSINFFNIFFDRSGGTFTRDSELGLTSEAFALQGNIDREDRRNGLDKKAKLRILWYMFYYEEDFDEARLRYVKYQFLLNGIGEDGQPLDPKYISYD